eukprot:9487707-Pyramimonas_sp.AAC.2
MLALIGNICGGRRFRVADGATKSSERAQTPGISQGCLLSPFLYVILMTVLVWGAVAKLNGEERSEMSAWSLQVLLYADDTLLIGRNQDSLQHLLDHVAAAGAQVGMQLHWGKFQMMRINGGVQLRKPAGQLIAEKASLTYLGATLRNNGQVNTELNRTIGAAWSAFARCDRAWKLASICKRRKLELFDGFHVRCLPEILHMPPSFSSRIPCGS